jgi:hypothetical protein
MEIGTRVKVINENSCHRNSAKNVHNGDVGTVIKERKDYKNDPMPSQIAFDNGFVYWVPIKALKRLHVKKVATP